MSINPAVTYLVLFYAASMIIFTMYGGGFATIPAYLADIFGTKYVGGIHGRLLTAWSTAGVLGPVAITQLRQSSVDSAINELVEKAKNFKAKIMYVSNPNNPMGTINNANAIEAILENLNQDYENEIDRENKNINVPVVIG